MAKMMWLLVRRP